MKMQKGALHLEKIGEKFTIDPKLFDSEKNCRYFISGFVTA